MKKKLYLNGVTEWPSSIELITDIVDEYRGKPTTRGGKKVLVRERPAGQVFEFQFAEPIGDTTLSDLFEAGERFKLRVVCVEETEAEGQPKAVEYAEYVIEDLLPVRRVVTGREAMTLITAETMTPPRRTPKVKPPQPAGEAN